MNIKLYQLDKLLKNFIIAFLTLLTIALIVGLLFLMESSNSSVKGTVDRWNGSEVSENTDSFAIAEEYPKQISEMLLTTHNHLFGFAFIFGSIGFIFYFNSIVTGFIKKFLLIEPFISAVVTFGSIWLMRFYNDLFVYLALLSAIVMYLSYFIMYFVCMYELKFK